MRVGWLYIDFIIILDLSPGPYRPQCLGDSEILCFFVDYGATVQLTHCSYCICFAFVDCSIDSGRADCNTCCLGHDDLIKPATNRVFHMTGY